jgi:transcriptional regulator with XRE-family HTH domain
MANRTKLTKRLIKKITTLIEFGETNVTRICSLTGISRRTWSKWEADKSTRFAESIARARARERAKQDERLVRDSKRSLLMLLQGFYLTTVETKTEFDKEGEGNETTTTVSYSFVPPCMKTILFVLNNLDEANFKSRLQRHVAAKKGYIAKAVSQKGGNTLTIGEALHIGIIGSDRKVKLLSDAELSEQIEKLQQMLKS